jgi:hypothetical protein
MKSAEEIDAAAPHAFIVFLVATLVGVFGSVPVSQATTPFFGALFGTALPVWAIWRFVAWINS